MWLPGEMTWVLSLCILCSAAFCRWCWVCWVRRQGRREKNGERGTRAGVISQGGCAGISDGSGSGGSESAGLTRRAVGRSSGRRDKTAAAGGGGEGRRIPRGSTGWPFIGETLDFITCANSSRPVSFMEKRRELYGSVFKSHILGMPVVVSTDAEVNRAVLQSDGFVPWYPRSLLLLLGESSILRKTGAHHRRVHGLVGGFVKSPVAKALVAERMQRCMVQLLGRWHEGQLVYVQDEAKEISFQVLVKLLMGLEPGEESDFLKKEFIEFMQGLVCLPIKLPGMRLCKSLKAKEKMLQLVRKIVEDRISKPKRSSAKDVIDALLDELVTTDEQQMSIDSFASNIIELMLPADHSVPEVMTIAVKYLTDSPPALKQLMVENMNLKREKSDCHEPYAWTDFMSLTFTQHVISETLRMANIVNSAWRKAVKDIEINGYLIPKDWCIFTSFSSIHLDEEIYSNPYEFNPWRWEMKQSGMSNFTPFGGGQRLCPGQDIARLEISIFLHYLVTNYSLVAGEDTIINFPYVKMKNKMPVRISAISI